MCLVLLKNIFGKNVNSRQVVLKSLKKIIPVKQECTNITPNQKCAKIIVTVLAF